MRLIDADALMAQINDCVFTADMTTTLAVNMACRWIGNAPTIEPEPQWIPCSEMVPEKQGIYTVTDSKGDVVRFVFYNNKSSREYWKRCAKAWMPLPKPYAERRQDGDK